MRALRKVKIKWSPDFAYAIGLLTTDGSLSSDGRHMNLTSKDRGLIEIFKTCLGLKNKIGRKMRKGWGKTLFSVAIRRCVFLSVSLKTRSNPTNQKPCRKYIFQNNTSLISCAVILMEMELFILIGILVGNPVLCSTLFSHRQAEVTYYG